jgi:predicted RNase H-like HicB family nuclease
MRKYLAVIEKASERNWSGYFPDLPGCVATGRNRAACKKNLNEALHFHIEGLKLENIKLPKPTTTVELLEV